MRSLSCIHALVIPIWILIDISRHVATLHTSFCIRLPKDSVVDGTYGETGDPNVTSVGIEKFPQDIWSKYLISRENMLDDGTGTGSPTTTTQLLMDGTIDLNIALNPIRGRPGGAEDPLNGWFRVQISLIPEAPFSEMLKSFILYATDDQQTPIGSFEHVEFTSNEGSCVKSDATKYMIIPCGGVGPHEPFASNVILWARNKSHTWPDEYKQYWPIVPIFDEHEEEVLNFYFRYSIQASNKNGARFQGIHLYPRNLIMRIVADPDENYMKETGYSTQSLFKNGLLSATASFNVRHGAIPGAADPLASDLSTLSCEHAIPTLRLSTIDFGTFFETEYLQRNYLWFIQYYFGDFLYEGAVNGLNQVLIEGKPVLHAFSIHTKTGCSGRFFSGRCDSSHCSKANENPGGTFSPLTKRIKPLPDLIPQVMYKTCQCIGGTYPVMNICINEEPEVPSLFNNEKTVFHDCLDLYKKQAEGQRCEKIKDDVENFKIKVIRRTHTEIKMITVDRGVTHINGTYSPAVQHSVDQRGVRVYGFGTVLYAVRKGHGIVMVIVTFFCVPVSIFVSRYYKETFMTRRILYSRVWFQIHIQLVFWMITFVVSGLLLAFVGRGFLGVSLHPYGVMHRVFGWITIVIFFIIACTGGIRVYEDPGRSRSIIAHWAIGYIFYIFCMLSVISSIHVPGSPFAQRDKSVDVNNGQEPIGNFVYIVISFWILFELVVHVSMNFLLFMYDRWMQVEAPRKFLPPFIGVPIPVLKENSEFDASGNGIRLIAFWVYIGVSALVAVLCVGICIKGTPSVDKGFGPMSCTHEYNGSLTDALYHRVKYQMRKSLESSCI